MTDATSKPPNVLELVAERFGVDVELPQREPGRAADRLEAIAAIHALADWYVAHPAVPVPHVVTASGPAGTAVDLVGLATMLDVTVHGDDQRRYFNVELFARYGDAPLFVNAYVHLRDERPL